MLKIGSICAALILAMAAFSTSAEARGGHGGHGGFSGGFKGASVGGFRGASIGSFRGIGGRSFAAAPYRGARVGTLGGRGIYRGAVGPSRYSYGRYGGKYAYGRHGYWDKHRYPYYRYGYRGYYGGYGYNDWWWGAGALALAAAGTYYGGYDDCYQTLRVQTPYGWRWRQVYVCDYPYR
jgi:hypothetical protein